MSVENELKERLNLQEGDEVTSISDLYQSYTNRRYYMIGIPPQLIKCNMDGSLIVKRQNGKMGIYTQKGEVVIPEGNHKCWPEFYYDEEYHCEAIFVQSDGITEAYSYDGKKRIIPKQYKKLKLKRWGIKATNNGWNSWTAYSYQGGKFLHRKLLVTKKSSLKKILHLFVTIKII